MFKNALLCIAAFLLGTSGTIAATFSYDVRITDITGEGQPEGIGFFQTAMIGDIGTGFARTDTSFPSTTSGVPAPDNRSFSVTFPGVASALWLFNNPMVHDPLSGTVRISGSLGGLTDFGATDFISADTYEFVWQGAPGGAAFSSILDYEAFLSSASMSGYFSGFMFVNGDFDTGYLQRIDFEANIAPVPLPGAGPMLLVAVGLMAFRARRR